MSERYTFEKRDGRLAMIKRHAPYPFEWINVGVIHEPCYGQTYVYVALADEDASHLLANEGGDGAAIRAQMDEWLSDNDYALAIPTDFDDEEDCSASEQLAEKFREQFLGGDFTPFTHGVFIRWFSRDCLNTMALGECYSFWHAEIFLPELLRQVLAACATDHERQIILDGHFYLVRSLDRWRDSYGDPLIVEANTLLSDYVRQAA